MEVFIPGGSRSACSSGDLGSVLCWEDPWIGMTTYSILPKSKVPWATVHGVTKSWTWRATNTFILLLYWCHSSVGFIYTQALEYQPFWPSLYPAEGQNTDLGAHTALTTVYTTTFNPGVKCRDMARFLSTVGKRDIHLCSKPNPYPSASLQTYQSKVNVLALDYNMAACIPATEKTYLLSKNAPSWTEVWLLMQLIYILVEAIYFTMYYLGLVIYPPDIIRSCATPYPWTTWTGPLEREGRRRRSDRVAEMEGENS